MSVPLIDPDAPLEFLLEENSHTLGELQAHPLASPYTPKFDAFQADWDKVNGQRIALVIAVGKAQGAVAGADDALNDFVDLLDRTLLIITKNDRAAALYQLYFGAKAPNLLKRPLLGAQLETQRAWIPSIEGSPYPAIAALAPTLKAAVAAADAAALALSLAEQALKDFDTIGAKKALVDAFNALRKTVWGELAALPHQNPAAMLPANFADRFFRHNTHKGPSLTSIKDVQARVDKLQKDLAAAQDRLAALTAAEQQKANLKLAADAADAAAALASKEADASARKAKELAKEASAKRKKSRV
jgi:hypothetical protein